MTNTRKLTLLERYEIECLGRGPNWMGVAASMSDDDMDDLIQSTRELTALLKRKSAEHPTPNAETVQALAETDLARFDSVGDLWNDLEEDER